MLSPDAKNWSNQQIVLFSKWLENRNHTVFITIAAIKRHLTKINVPFYIIRAKQHEKITRINKFKHVYLLAIGDKKHHIAIRLRRIPIKRIKAGGLWTHQLVLAIMVFANLIQRPETAIDAGGQPTLAFCIKTWNQFLDYKLADVEP